MNFLAQLEFFTKSLALFIYRNPWAGVLISIWALTWKGLALWRSARKNQRYWFVALLVLNTLGLLEILYLFVFSERKSKKSAITETQK